MNIPKMESWLATFRNAEHVAEGRDPEKEPRSQQAGLDLQSFVRNVGEVPHSFKPLSVIHEGVETQVRIGIGNESGCNHPQIIVYRVVRKGGTFLYGGGALVQVVTNDTVSFVLCSPAQYKYMDQSGLFVPRAELYVNGGTPVLTTRFEQ